ncbi:MAG: hypothetical protein A2219_02215 [Elusimicrobia bacterium RIFOXYA2_FULL_50_26]|nr:MAG: hypothetical protein A2219_02215 [Elusimicrobia bacterium RIFOXYA2_FULL_50_26]OGS23762.1 MAG: hypothetical protein A2314_03625 [Elusimicrobia bacterium RIFOXYB2_FULL_50_12]
MTRETKLGLFVLLGAALLVLSVVLLGDFQLQRRYYLNVLFDDVAGLPSKAKVKIAGVEVGGVKDIVLEGKKAKVRIWIKHGIEVHRDAEARIVSTGIIGSKYLELTMGSSAETVLQDGDAMYGINPISFERVIAEAMEKLDTLVSAFSGPEMEDFGRNLSTTVANLRDITETLREGMEDQETKISGIIDNTHSFTQDISEITSASKENITAAVKDIRSVGERLDRILAKLEAGQGTIGKLMSDDEMGNDLKLTFTDLKETSKEARRVLKRINLIETDWNYRLRYDGKYKMYRYDVGLRVIPEAGKFYYVGVSNAGEKSEEVFDPEVRGTIDFLIGQQFGPATVYAGALRSKGGVGVSVQPFWKWEPWRRLEIHAEAYNFSRTAPVSMPKVNVGGKFPLVRWASVGAQVEDIYYESNLNTYVHLEFKDDDIGYVLGLVGLAR